MDKIEIKYRRYGSLDELCEKDREMIEKAMDACKGAYAPFSGFKVGAALLKDDGSYVVGSNQESEVLPSGMCAERVALYYFQSNFSDRKVVKMAIYAPDSKDICSPCAACRQVILDTINRQKSPIMLYMAGQGGVVVVDNAKDLIPFYFSL